MRDSLALWDGSESEKEEASATVLEDLIHVVADEEKDVCKYRKLVNEQGLGVAMALKANPTSVQALLSKSIRAKSLYESHLKHSEKNKHVFEHIVGHHHHLQELVGQKGHSWEEAIETAEVASETGLQKYAEAAQIMGSKDWVVAGNRWMIETALEYFLLGGARKARLKALKLAFFAKNARSMTEEEANAELEKMNANIMQIAPSSSSSSSASSSSTSSRKIRLLDVGSCYNPFANDDKFHVTALDLCPIDASVMQCDFLALALGPPDSAPVIEQDEKHPSGKLLQLPRGHFDVITLSLVLSYLPSPAQRLAMVQKARQLLVAPPHCEDDQVAPEDQTGLLLIVEKESAFDAAGVKAWKAAIQSCGFDEGKYRVIISERRKSHAFCFRTAAMTAVCSSSSSASASSSDAPEMLVRGKSRQKS